MAFKYVLSVEGNDIATNLKWLMATNSLWLMAPPVYETWFMEGRLEAGKHYVPLRPDFADLEKKILYYERHADEALEIIQNAQAHVRQFLDEKCEQLISLLVLFKCFVVTGQIEPDSRSDLFSGRDPSSAEPGHTGFQPECRKGPKRRTAPVRRAQPCKHEGAACCRRKRPTGNRCWAARDSVALAESVEVGDRMPRPEADRQSGEVAFGQRLIAANEEREALSRKLFGELPHPGGVARQLEEETSVPPGSVVSPPDMDADDEISIPAQPRHHHAARLLKGGIGLK